MHYTLQGNSFWVFFLYLQYEQEFLKIGSFTPFLFILHSKMKHTEQSTEYMLY